MNERGTREQDSLRGESCSELKEPQGEKREFWQMSFGEFERMLAIRLHGFDPQGGREPTVEDLEAFERAISEPEISQTREFLASLLPDYLKDDAKAITGLDSVSAPLIEKAHHHQVEQAFSAGLPVPDEVLARYPEIMQRKRIRDAVREKKDKLNPRLEQIILSNFDRIDLSTRRSFRGIVNEFNSLFSGEKLEGITIEEDDSEVLFRDEKSGLVYVTVYRNARINLRYQGFFDVVADKAENARYNFPVKKIRELAVLIRNEDRDIEREYLTVKRGTAEVQV